VPVLDALKTFDGPKIEVLATGVICGLGRRHELALIAVMRRLKGA
jgi:3-dehydroquinate dehydratase